MQQAATTDPTGLSQIPQAPPLGLALGILFVLALTLFVFVLKRKHENASSQVRPAEPQARQQGEPFVIGREESTPAPACCTVAEAVRDYFSDPPLSLLTRFGEIIASSHALAQLRAQLEADMDQKLEERFTAHRAETDRLFQAHRSEVQRLLTQHVIQVNKVVSDATKNQTTEVVEAIKALLPPGRA